MSETEQTKSEKEPTDHISTMGLDKAIATYRKTMTPKDPSKEPSVDIEARVREMESREVVENDSVHEPQDLAGKDGQIMIGPPVLTRFEKARIMGSRALQLSQGAPPFIDIPKTARTSLDIAMEELEQRIIPIVIRRVLPNGDYQNIPISYFAAQ